MVIGPDREKCTEHSLSCNFNSSKTLTVTHQNSSKSFIETMGPTYQNMTKIISFQKYNEIWNMGCL